MNQVLKWVGKGVAVLALPAASVALMAYGVYLTLVP
jgi:hypothetical protein